MGKQPEDCEEVMLKSLGEGIKGEQGVLIRTYNDAMKKPIYNGGYDST